MSETVLENVSVEVDDEPLIIIPGSLKFKEGIGERKVSVAMRGGRPVTVFSDDSSTKKGYISFDTISSPEGFNSSRDISARGISRTVKISGTTMDGVRFGRTLTGAVMINDPEKTPAPDAAVTMEFEGSPLVPS